MPLQATSGAASYDAFGGGVPVVPNYIEDVFSTYLYTGNSTARSITNNIDLSTKGGLVWLKNRSVSVVDPQHTLTDTARGATKWMESSGTGAQVTTANTLTAFNTNGFSLGVGDKVNENGITYASWTFRKQPKFFDVATATTNGLSSYGSTTPSMTIAHSLGSVPGCVIVKRTDNTGGWYVWHRSLPALSGLAQTATYIQLNTTGAAAIFGGNVNGTGGWIQATSTHIYLDAWFNTYEPGDFVVYVFAHDAGGFGLTGTDNVISCGTYTGNGSTTGPVIDLGYEPQWIMIKNASATTFWRMFDNMRGIPVPTSGGSIGNSLEANTTAAEAANDPAPIPTATGFRLATTNSNLNGNGNTMIYIAIRRGPMKVPTDATKVFEPNASAGTGSTRTITTNFPVDFQLANSRAGSSGPVRDRLRGGGVGTTKQLLTTTDTAETTLSSSFGISFDNNTGIGLYQTTSNASSTNYIYYHFRRAPSFFDEVCYIGNGVSGRNITHNLTVSPELVIIKSRNRIDDWVVRSSAFPTHGVNGIAYLNSTGAATNAGYSYVPTTTTFQVESNNNQNGSSYTYVAYLFATCAGVSKVGSFSYATGSSTNVDCGFTSGARFVMIKQTDGVDSWYVFDTARGIVAGNDPFIELNSSAAENSGFDVIDPYSAGFTIPAGALGTGTFIFLAIA